MLRFLSCLFRDQTGVTAIEYALVASTIAISAVTFMGIIGADLNTTFSTVANSF
jgi:pilus assembly protein Flp/PilA